MNASISGMLLRQARLTRNWSQEGLCRGICAVSYLSKIEQGKVEAPTVMELHKLAIACEKLGRRAEALAALDLADSQEAEYPDGDLAREMCALVRLRLEDEDYLRKEDYGRRLLSLFDRCRRELPIGYAAFHLPWVAEWYTATRQYRAAYELLRDFPVKVPLPL